MLSLQKVPTQEITTTQSSALGVKVFVKRLDLIHPLISGNKFFKLKYNLEKAKESGYSTILTFGGAFSNHIYATAAAAKAVGFRSIGIIRGEQTSVLNPTLNFAKENGMTLHFMGREMYRKKHTKEVVDELRGKFGDFYLVPEGGTNALAIQGSSEILTDEDMQMDYICCSIGTGGTISGILQSASSDQNVLGFPSLKGQFIIQEIEELLNKYRIKPSCKWQVFTDYHFGGYAKHRPELIEFIKEFKRQYDIPLDPIYTGKLFFGVMDLLKKRHFPKGAKILLLHSGGLQGIEGFNLRHKESL